VEAFADALTVVLASAATRLVVDFVDAFAAVFVTALVEGFLGVCAFTDFDATILRAGRPRFAAGCSISSSAALRLAVVALLGADAAVALVLELFLDAVDDPAATAFLGGMVSFDDVERTIYG